MRKIFFLFILFASGFQLLAQQPDWPETTNVTQPWTRWWWHGSTVNPGGLTANMEQLQEIGLGGVEITPIYDVKGYENEAISFLSDQWMEMLEYTLKEGDRLNLGVDLANASGWPFGGPWIGAEDACKNLHFKQFTLNGGEQLKEKVEFIQEPMVRAIGHRLDISEIKFPISSNPNLQELALEQVRFEKPLPLQALMAYNKTGEVIDLTEKVSTGGTLNWTAPEGTWNLYAVFQGWHGKMVERAGTGGEGNVIDHFSEAAADKFLKIFDEAAKDADVNSIRTFFNDSYEVDDASGESDWTPLLFEEFKNRRGYDLKNHLPALFGNDSEEMNNRVLCDYRETISDLLLDRFTKVWADWAKKYDAGIRNQAHGSPANILDLYAASDIPETEGTNPMRIKMATSAAHVSGKPLVSCEASTWLDEHFLANLGTVKQNLDRYFANGVNHIFYHGTPYSPVDEKWPGWMFYAAVHFAPTNSWWPDFKAINEYVTRSQSFLQIATPDNDILMYFPIYDTWSEQGRSRLPHFGGSFEPLTKELSEYLLQRGYTFDYISDKQIQELEITNGEIKAPGANYKTIVVPKCNHIPLATMQKLVDLVNTGATIIFQENLPKDVPGFYDVEERQMAFQKIKESIHFESLGGVLVDEMGSGKCLTGENIDALLSNAGVFPEEMAQVGLWFNRVKRDDGTCYFISNWSDKKVDQWITVQSAGDEAALFNPMNQEIGKAKIQKMNEKQSRVYLQLEPGETVVLQWYSDEIDIEDYPLWNIPVEKTVLKGEWTVSFLKGGPTLPDSYTTTSLNSWTEHSEEHEKFSGTGVYELSFKRPDESATAFLLDLGKVCESATIVLNGEKMGTVVGPEYQLVIDASKLEDVNKLEVQVSNLMANRIIDLDKRGVNYKKFYNVNFAARKRENVGKDGLFTAANWEPLESGLIGPVTLTPVTKKMVEIE
ncbi:glycoside hydrolase family 2 protein [Maribellus comscasis]|uniref:Glycoside hydrolase family 2 protein n=1 Tax=Maribellus comscasis TaxID=2681766 RepID=A0A6I6JWB0_9BACT|nr:glycosyl hydrolase [Maribellus comscasis]QGY47416.1 glycoside hydrolase family 2 protein [Maribellus comscasis]